jgi:hypothetical protein
VDCWENDGKLAQIKTGKSYSRRCYLAQPPIHHQTLKALSLSCGSLIKRAAQGTNYIMLHSPMRRSAITVGNGVSIFNLDLIEYRKEKARTAQARIAALIARYIALVSIMGAVGMAAALLTPVHFV